MKKIIIVFFTINMCVQLWAGGNKEIDENKTKVETIIVSDSYGNNIELIKNPQRIICSGPGALRLAVYLQAQDRVIAVDDMEKSRKKFDARPYALANRNLKELPLFGEFRGYDNPELILGLDPQPQVIFKTYPNSGYNPKELQQKTGIPVVSLNYGDLGDQRKELYNSLIIMGRILECEERAKEVIDYIEKIISDVDARTANILEADKPSCYIGGIAYSGPHGIQSTEPLYPPFQFVRAKNVAFNPINGKNLEHADMAKEKILEWNPDILFIDASTVMSGDRSGAIYELQNEEIFKELKAVKSKDVYGVLPYNWYTCNYGSVLANAYFVGKILYAERFSDIDPIAKADEIYSFLVGLPVVEQMIKEFEGLPFSKIELND